MNLRRRDWTVTLALALVTGSAAAAQPSSPQASPQAGKVIPLVQRLCDALHALPAQRRQECCGRYSGSLAAVCAEQLSSAIHRGTIAIDVAAVDRCAAEMAQELQGCAWVTPLQPPLPRGCEGLASGSLSAGTNCRSSLECPVGLYCRGLSPSRPGVCRPPASPGARCESNLPDNLAALLRAKEDRRHLECQGQCNRGRCVAFVPAGEPCTAAAPCASGLNCIAGRCLDWPLPAVGEPCAGKTRCAPGAFCEAGTCAALRSTGAPCALPFECRALACEKSPGAKTGTCADPCADPTAKLGPKL